MRRPAGVTSRDSALAMLAKASQQINGGDDEWEARSWRRRERNSPPLPKHGKKWACHGGSDVSTDLHAVARHCTNRIPDLRENDQGGKPEER